jgi:hypothetical protein
MASIIVRFPAGAKEYRYLEKELKEGDILWHEGEPYRIVDISGDTPAIATVQRVPDEDRTSQRPADLESEIRAARNETVLRDLNERLKTHNEWLDERLSEWVCECANDECTIPVELSIEEYEGVRREPTRFVVAPGDAHVDPEIERVFRREERYWVVEKIGIGAEVANGLDPRT